MDPNHPIDFAPFRLDPASGLLLKDGVPVPLTPKAFGMLHYLASRADRLVSKQELLDAIWPKVFVGDAVLKVTIGEIRRALGDDPKAPKYIATAHRRGYRFTVARSAEVGTTGLAPQVKYARSGSVNVAYQVVGSGPIDLVFVMGWVSHLEYFWREPSFAAFLTRLASTARLILFDKRGTGLSDPVPVSQLPTLEERLDDVRAVMDAAGSERAVLLGVSEGGPLCTLFAATYPERTEALLMIGSYARRLVDHDYPWGKTLEAHDAFCDTLLRDWGGPVGLDERAPSQIDNAAFRDWWATYLRMGASPGAAVALTRMNAQIDVRDVLPAIRVPTLVVHRTGDRCLKVEEGRYLASHIPGATFVELPGEDHLPFVGNQDDILGAIAQFLSIARTRPDSDRVLTTVLSVNATGEAGDLTLLQRVFAREVGVHRGRVAGVPGARLVAMFDGPGRAVRCGRSVASALSSRASLSVRGGVHIGECAPAATCAPVIDLSAALADAAAAGDVLVSRTVVDLVHGSGLQFEERQAIADEPRARSIQTFAVI
ncbi:MAG TPA: alpha/beta fold hydrolase [Vicinamibacterales bacterium]|nr:alpha/beta fold hydrolase [Vicinamibacterales bacterium]